MILEIIAYILFSTVAFIIIWFVIFKVLIKFEKRNMLRGIGKKIEKQNNKFIIGGKEVIFKEEIIKEEKINSPAEEEEMEIIEDVHTTPAEVETVNETVKQQIKTVKPTVKKLPTFEGDKFKLPEFE